MVRKDEMREVRALTLAVAQELKQIMDGKSVTQSQIAKELGRAQSFVSVRLDGQKPLSMDDLDAIAKVLDMSGEDLLIDIARRLDGVGAVVTPIRPNVSPTVEDVRQWEIEKPADKSEDTSDPDLRTP